MKTEHDWHHCFSRRDFLDADNLAKTLHGGVRAVDKHLVSRFTEAGRIALEQYIAGAINLKAITDVLIVEFDRLIEAGPLHDEEHFAGIELRRGTEKLRKKCAQGRELVRLNKRLLQDLYPDYLLHEGSTPAGKRVVEGITFTLYRITRVLKHKVSQPYQIEYTDRNGPRSGWAKSEKELDGELQTLADKLHAGELPLKRDEAKDRDAKAKAYDAVIKAVAKAGIQGEENVLEFVADAARAQVLIGPTRPLLSFVLESEKVMPKPTDIKMLTEAFADFKAFNKHGREKVPEGILDRIRAVQRFILAAPKCEQIAKALIAAQIVEPKMVEEKLGSESVFHNEIIAGELKKATLMAGSNHPQIYFGDVTPLGIGIWLNSLGVQWKQQRECLSSVRNFFSYVRDTLHALPPGPTAAHKLPLPKRTGKKSPVVIMYFRDFWRVLLNCQDLDALFYIALGGLAGLHASLILKLEWGPHIIWEKEEPVQIYIPPGFDKETQGLKPSTYIPIRFPLNKILKLAKTREGRIVKNNSIQEFKVRRLILRLGVPWVQSIMRHTCTSYLIGAGVPLKEVADIMRDRLSTLLLYYFLALSKPEADQMWTLPVDLKPLEQLPQRRRYWDWKSPLKDFCPEPINTADPSGPAQPSVTVTASKTFPWSIPNVSGEPKVTGGPMAAAILDGQPSNFFPGVVAGTDSILKFVFPTIQRRHPCRLDWPCDIEFLVWVWDMTLEKIQAKMDCSKRTVRGRLLTLGIEPPDFHYWYRIRKGLPVEVPECVKEARLLIASLKR